MIRYSHSMKAFGAAVALALMPVATCDAKTEPATGDSAAGVFRLKLGDMQILALSDGVAPRALGEVLPVFEGKEDGKRAIEIPINAYLVVSGGKNILIDTGAGTLLGPTTGGRIVANLAAAGIRPDQIDVILLTHTHPDHIGGLVADGARRFPNAMLYVDRRDLMTGPPPPALNPAVAGRLAALRRFQDMMIEPYRQAGKLHPFEGATQLFPGIRSMSIPGHSPGHSAYMLESRGKRLLIWGDIVHVGDVQFHEPAITAGSDASQPLAAETRLRLMTLAAKDQLLVASSHVAFPGLGHVMRAGKAFVWKPVSRR